MPRTRTILAVLTLGLLLPAVGSSQPRRSGPTLEPIAETRLLMEGLAHPNFKALDRQLQEQPEDAEAWQFARGQSLIIAETANLLMLRPPKNARAEEVWMSRATDLRDSASKLAKATAANDLSRSRAALAGVASSCNRCHESFRVEVRLEVSERKK
jgi:cytochrome c556